MPVQPHLQNRLLHRAAQGRVTLPQQSQAADAWRLIKRVANSWIDDYVPSMGAALAYYTMFSLAPLLLIVISAAGMVFGEDAARGEIEAELRALMGAMATAILFMVGKWLIGLYIGRSGVVSGFGAAGSLVVVLVWVYYSAQIFLIGAEFTWVYANAHGSRKGLNDN